MGFNSGLKGLKRPTVKQSKLVHLHRVLYKWCTAMRSKGKHMTVPMIIEERYVFYDEIKITDLCTFSEGWLCIGACGGAVG
jgi:hypothetical protein